MFFHKQELQFKSTPDKPDAVYARKLQEVLGGQYGEITVAMQYGFQSWNSHLPGKYRDLLYGIAAEEMGHVEMLAIMIAQLLEKALLGITGDAVDGQQRRRKSARTPAPECFSVAAGSRTPGGTQVFSGRHIRRPPAAKAQRTK